MRAATLLLALLCAAPAAAKPQLGPVAPQPIAIEARPVALDRERPERTAFGALTFLGGVELRSPMRAFGGFSGILLDATGRHLVAVSDAGLWLTARVEYERERVTGLSAARIGTLLDGKGKPLIEIKDSDAEAIADAGGGNLFIGFERRHRIGVFPLGADGVGRQRRLVALPAAMSKASANSGIEGLAVLSAGRLKGTLVAFAENLRDKDGNRRGWLIGGTTAGIALRRLDDHAVTDLAALSNGDLLVLERHFTWSTGIRMRIRRIAAADIRPGAIIDGAILIEAGPTLGIDNMEAMAVHRDTRGRTVITLMSDDNYNLFQRTLLLQFRLDEGS